MNALEPKKLPYHAFMLFKEKYARASKKFAEYHEFSDSFTFKVCRENRKQWECYKFTVKFIECWLNHLDCDSGAPTMPLGEAFLAEWADIAEDYETCPSYARIQGLVHKYFKNYFTNV